MKRRGFSALELLVVLAIITVLVSLLVPAVQSGRRAALRVQCLNNLKQIGLGLHNYHASHAMFPKGGHGGPLDDPTRTVGRIASWSTALLPYVEQNSMYNVYNHDQWYGAGANGTATYTHIRMFLCPSSPNTDPLRPDVNAVDNFHHFGRSDYAGNRGEAGLRCGSEADCPNRDDRGWGGGRGVLLAADDPSVSIESIADGTAQTAVVGEAPESIHGYWAGPWNFFAQRVPINARLALAGDTKWSPCVVPGGNSGLVGRLGCDDGQAYHSYHAGGAHFVLADGSVRYVRETMSSRVLAALLSRDGGEVFSDE